MRVLSDGKWEGIIDGRLLFSPAKRRMPEKADCASVWSWRDQHSASLPSSIHKQQVGPFTFNHAKMSTTKVHGLCKS